MKIEAVYSHLNGYEYILAHRPYIWAEIELIVEAIDAERSRNRVPRERLGSRWTHYVPVGLSTAFESELVNRNWEKTSVPHLRAWGSGQTSKLRRSVSRAQRDRLMPGSEREPPVYKGLEFIKELVAIEIQFTEYSFLADDGRIRHVQRYTQSAIDVAVEFYPARSLWMSSSRALTSYEYALDELVHQGRRSPAVPLVLVGIAP